MLNFFNSLHQIAHSESVTTFRGVYRHLNWQIRKITRSFPCELLISYSKLLVDRPSGIAALVNAMGQYDFNNMSLVRSLLIQNGGSFIDVGANIGTYTLIASEAERANVVSIEPDPQTFRFLEQNVRLNKRDNVTCLNVALSASEGELRLTQEADSATNRISNNIDRATRTLQVPARRLDQVCRDLEVIPDFVKIDVEGHHKEVLHGFGEYRSAPKIVVIEDGEDNEVKAWMHSAGYSGPWFVHFNYGVLAKQRQARAEDPIFVRVDLLPDSSSLNGESNLDLGRLLKREFRDRGTRTWL